MEKIQAEGFIWLLGYSVSYLVDYLVNYLVSNIPT
jgi:hypothetical protein